MKQFISYFNFFIILFVIHLSVGNVINFTLEETFAIKTRICNRLKSCNDCNSIDSDSDNKENDDNKNKFLSISRNDEMAETLGANIFSYGIPFVGDKIFFTGPCDCNKIKRAKTLCSELDITDRLPGLSDIDLSEILINDSQKTESKNDKEKEEKSNVMRFKEKNKIKASKTDCNCMNQVKVKRSLFCENQCQKYSDYIKKISTFYDQVIKSTDSIFKKEMDSIKSS